MLMPFQIYVADISPDLDSLRGALAAQISAAGMQAVWMSAEDKASADLSERVRARMQSADAVLCVVTYRRGWEPDAAQGRSLAEIEFDLAHEQSKPMAVLMPSEDSELSAYLRMRAAGQDEGDKQAQQTFWQRAAEGALTFRDEADLSAQVARLLGAWTLEAVKQIPKNVKDLFEAQFGASPLDTLLSRPAFEREEAVATETAVPAAPAPQAQAAPASGIDVEALAERVAEKTAERVQALQQQQQRDLAEQTLKYNDALRLKPGELVFGHPRETAQFKGDIFMVMPFAAEFAPVYTDIVKPLVLEMGLTITRGDEFHSVQGGVMGEVWSALNSCKFVIAEITGGNDNVFYELGIAHTLNKPAILVTQAEAPQAVPFDIRHLRYIKYANTIEGSAQLREELRTAITRLLADLNEGWGDHSA